MSFESFIALSDQGIAAIEDELRQPVSHRGSGRVDRELLFMLRAIRQMRDLAVAGSLPPKSQRQRRLTRVITDQWPLGSKLASLIVDIESRFLNL